MCVRLTFSGRVLVQFGLHLWGSCGRLGHGQFYFSVFLSDHVKDDLELRQACLVTDGSPEGHNSYICNAFLSAHCVPPGLREAGVATLVRLFGGDLSHMLPIHYQAWSLLQAANLCNMPVLLDYNKAVSEIMHHARKLSDARAPRRSKRCATLVHNFCMASLSKVERLVDGDLVQQLQLIFQFDMQGIFSGALLPFDRADPLVAQPVAPSAGSWPRS